MGVQKIPKVAIITRTMDREMLLERALLSIYSQTMTDFVHVIINNGGKKECVTNLLAKHKNIFKSQPIVIHNEVNENMYAASNRAIKSVDSEYVVMHDDDDAWHPDFLKETTAQLDKTGDMGIVATTDLIYEKIKNNKVIKLEEHRMNPDLQHINLYKMCFQNFTAPINFLYRRSVFDKIGYYDEALGTVGDWDFGLRFLSHYEIMYLRTVNALAYYSHRPKSTGTNANNVFTLEHRYFENLLANKYLRNDLRDGKLGLGYMINSLQYEKEFKNKVTGDLADLNNQNAKLANQLIELDLIIKQRTSLGDIIKRSSVAFKRTK